MSAMPVGQIARRTFAHRSIRVIALSRLAIAVLFGVWVRIDPMQPVRYPDAGLLLFEGYVLYSLALLLVAWRNWWLDFRLSGPAYVGDCLIFLTALFFTQSRETDLISPFTTFFVYLVLAAVLRWQGRHALSATLALAAAFTLTGFGMAFYGIDIDTMNFVRRASFMGVLAILLTWFARERGIVNAPRFHPMAEHEEPDMMEQALQYAMRNMDASGAALRWARLEEPGITLAGAGLLRDSSGLFPPFLSNPDENAVPVLFDLRRDRAIGYYEGRLTLFDDCGEVPVLLNALGISEGLSLPLPGSMGCGELVLVGIEGMCVDHVLFGRHIAREITRILDEEENRAAARERELMHERSSIARDLHDSVVQSSRWPGRSSALPRWAERARKRRTFRPSLTISAIA
ncbi:hypothetical protein [Croceicoccus mobilis]|nr:hypothetical protein [Croceicoccus mobilis]